MSAERFSIERSYRPAERGPNPKVADGWIVADSILGTRRWTETKAEAEATRDAQLEREATVRETGAAAVCWWTTLGSALGCELWLVLDAAKPGSRLYAGLVAPEKVAALLELVGLPELEEEWA